MANYLVTTPDGTKLQVTGPDGADPAMVQQVAQQYHEGMKQKVLGSQPQELQDIINAPRDQNTPEGSISKGLIQGAYNIGRQGIELPFAGFAGIKAMATGHDPEAAMSAVTNFGNWTSNKPRQEATNEAMQNAVGTLVGLPQKIVDKGTDLTNQIPFVNAALKSHPGLQKAQDAMRGIAEFGVNAAPMMFGPKITPGKIAEPTPASEAIGLGYKIPPSDAVLKGAKAPIGRIVEGLTSSDKLKVAASVKNQVITNRLAAESIGLPKDIELTPENLNAALEPHYKVYEQVKSLGNIPIDDTFKSNVAKIGQESADAFPGDTSPKLNQLLQAYLEPKTFGSKGGVLKIRQLRKDGNLNISSRDPERIQLGYAQREIANQIEDQIDRYASSRPEGFDKSGLIKDFRKARQEIAKIETVRSSITPGTTDVSAAYLAKQLNKNKPLSGNLEKIAEVTNNFPYSMRNAGPLRQKVPVNMTEGFVGGGLGIAGAATHNPLYFKEALLSLGARPGARAALLSDAYQRGLLPKKPLNPFMLDLLSGGALTSGTAGNNPFLVEK